MKEPDMYTNAKGRAYSHSLGNCICKIDIQTVAIRSIFISIVLYSVVFIVCMRMHLLSRVCTVHSQTIRVGWIAFYSYHMRMPSFGTLLNLRMICSIIVQSERRCSLFGASDVFNITYMSGKIVSNYDLFKHYNKYFYIAHWSFGVYAVWFGKCCCCYYGCSGGVYRHSSFVTAWPFSSKILTKCSECSVCDSWTHPIISRVLCAQELRIKVFDSQP